MAQDPFEQIDGAFEEAMGVFDEAFGEETDPDTKLYEGLEPADFRAMAREYGLTGTLDFIKRMEAKRMKRR